VNSGKSSGIGIVVIGRNEGSMLRRSLLSLPSDAVVLYVDSGSTDGSVELAMSLGFCVCSLDSSTPFSAARARQEGVARLLSKSPTIKYIQFVDGDCELEESWAARAVEYLDAHRHVAVVCGMITERSPGDSIYNLLSSLQWKSATGDIDACGGLFMVRGDVYLAAGGFNADLLTREERDLCRRVKDGGHRVVRVSSPMAVHDSGLLSFRQWWTRAVWGGYGDALEVGIQEGPVTLNHVLYCASYMLWPLVVPLLGFAGLIGSLWYRWIVVLLILCVLAFAALFLKNLRYRLLVGDSVKLGALYAVFRVVRKFAAGYGFALYFLQGSRDRRRPDPHVGR
jgi:glycosyltransferase involved in cell wall biosynthesis